MKPVLVFLIVIVVLLVAVFIAWLMYRSVRANAGVRRKEFETMRGERAAAWRVVNEVSEIVDNYTDIDSPLAAKLRPLIRKYQNERLEFRQ